ncbi:MAG: chain-length determining protein [Paraglaciecola sp.]|nr:chain-length determining protein [Paraglaciecola sp.]
MQDLQKTIELVIDYVRGVWIKKRYVMICSWLICPVGFFYFMSQPDTFAARARIFIDTQSVLQPLLRGLTIQVNPQQEVSMMVKTLLSRENLEKIARESDLDITAKNDAEYEGLINGLRNGIRLSGTGRDNIYTIAYSDRSPVLAHRVVQETLDLLVESAAGKNRKGTDTANQFIEEQIQEYESRLTAAEQRVVAYKQKYATLLPQSGSFFQNLSELQSQLDQTKLTIKETEQQMKVLTDKLSLSDGNSNDKSVANSNIKIPTQYDARIRNLEEKLDELSLRYTSLHPDVIETENLLSSLKKLRGEEINQYLAASPDAPPTEQVGSFSSELRIEASRLQSQIASLKVREANYENKIASLKDKMDLVPQVEAELTGLNRDYGITKSKYEQLLSRRESSELGQRADVSSEDLSFKVLDPPKVPIKPSGPNRLTGYVMVLFLGFGSGFAIAFLISQLNPVLLRASQLTTLTTYPVFGVVGHLEKAKILRVNRIRLGLFILSSSVILLMFLSLVTLDAMSINIYQRFFA